MYRAGNDDVRHRARPRLLQLPARRRDQPRAGEGAVGAARGDAGAPGDDRQADASGAGAVPRDGDAEPDRVRGHVRRCPRRRSTASCSRCSSTTRRAADELDVIDRALAEPVEVEQLALARGARRAAARRPRSVYVDPALVALRARARRRDARASTSAGSTSSRRTSSTAPARAGRSTSCSAPARSRSSAAAATCCRRTCASSRRTSSGTGSCSATRRSPKASTADHVLDRVLEAVAMPRPRLRARGGAHERRSQPVAPRAHARPARPGPLPAALLRKRRPDGPPPDRRPARRRPPRVGVRRRHRARPGPAVRPRRRRPPIDWNVTARTGEPHVRVHVAERAVEPGSLLDTSPSMTFGTADRRKWDVAEGVALAVGHFAVAARQPARRRDVRRPQRRRLAARGRAARACCRSCSRCGASRTSSRTGRPRSARRCDRRGRLARRRSLVVVVSDFRGPRDWRRAAAAARGPARRRRRRDPRSARAGAPRRRRPLARRPRVGPPAAGRHARRASCARGSASEAAAERARSRASCARPASPTSCSRPSGDWLRAARRRSSADRKEAAMSFAWPLALWGLALVALALVAYLVVAAAAAQLRRSASRT